MAHLVCPQRHPCPERSLRWHISAVSQKQMTFVTAVTPLPQRSAESVLKEHSGIGSNPCSYFYKYVCVQQGQRDSVLLILNPMTFSWGESLGLAGFVALPWPVPWIYQPGYTIHLAHDAVWHIEWHMLQGTLISVKSRHVLVWMACPWTGTFLRSDTSHSCGPDSGRAWICRWKVHTS